MLSLAAYRLMQHPIMRQQQTAPVFAGRQQRPTVHPTVARMAVRRLFGLPASLPAFSPPRVNPPGFSLGNYAAPRERQAGNPADYASPRGMGTGVSRGAPLIERTLPRATRPLLE